MTKYDFLVDVATFEDFMKVSHERAVSDASAKFCKPISPRQFGELYPEYHRRVVKQLQQEAVACQEYVAKEDMFARALGVEKFGK